jgi:cyclase
MSNYKDNLFLGADGNLFDMARRLRRHETKAEKFLWSKLCNKQLGVKFRRQHPLYTYVVDFYCHTHRLIIEVDGAIHNTKEANFDDSVRSHAFEEFKIEMIRFTNDEVLFHIENVLKKIKFYLNNFRGN